MRCKYLKWAINKGLLKQEGTVQRNLIENNSTAPQVDKDFHIVVPYSQGLCESYKTICSKYGVQVHLKVGQTLQNVLVFP